MTRVLLIDDEVRFLRSLAISLQARGYEVDTATTGEDGLDRAARGHPDIVVLDLGLPRMDGLDVLKHMRGWTDVPVIVLSARHQEPSKVAALDVGADDYVTKPFGMNELLARLRAALRRKSPVDERPRVVTDDFTIDLDTTRVTGAQGEEVHLTPTEWGIVSVLVRNGGKLVRQRQLLHEVWGPDHETETHYLRVYVAGIRRKLEPNPSRPRYFLTESGMGYRFEATLQ